jgi:hypothetical protein
MLPALASLAARRALSAGAPLMMLAASHPPAVASTSRPPRAAARALSTGARDGLDDVDRIHMRGMTFHGYHGVFAEVSSSRTRVFRVAALPRARRRRQRELTAPTTTTQNKNHRRTPWAKSSSPT